MGENPVLSDPDVNHVSEALEKLDFLVVQDIFLTETAQLADVVLPARQLRREGRHLHQHRAPRAAGAQGHRAARRGQPDWGIICELAKRMGAKGFDYDSAAEIMDEIARLTPSYGGISYERLDERQPAVALPQRRPPGTRILHTEIFSAGGKGNFVPLKYRPPVEITSDEYPLMLMTGRRLYHYHATMTSKVKGLNVLMPEELAEINPQDAEPLGINSGDMMKVTSQQGEVEVQGESHRGGTAGHGRHGLPLCRVPHQPAHQLPTGPSTR